MKNYFAKKTFGFYLSLVAAVLAAVSLALYSSASNQMAIVSRLTLAAIGVEALLVVLSAAMGNKVLFNLATVISAVLMGTALAQSFNSQLDALGYVVSGLYTMDQIMPFVRFAAVAAVSFLLFIVCSFLDLGKES